MRKRFIIFAILSSLQLTSNAAETTTDLSDNKDYLAAQTAGKCSGLFKFLTLLYKVKRDQTRLSGATAAATEWKTTTKAALSAAGLKRVKTIVMSDEIIEKEYQRYLYFMESTPKHLYPELETGLETCDANESVKSQYKP